MTEAVVPVGIVVSVDPHPASDNLDAVTVASLRGKVVNVANRPAPGQPRYQVGDYAAILRENLILPEALLRHLDLWDETKGKGLLSGSRGNRTKARRIAGVMSEVALCRVEWTRMPEDDYAAPGVPDAVVQGGRLDVSIGGVEDFITYARIVNTVGAAEPEANPVGYDLAQHWGVTVYQPT